MNIVLLFVALWIVTVVNAITRLKIDASDCDRPQKTVIDDAKNYPDITSHCGCTIKSNFTGELILTSNNACSPGFQVFDKNGTYIQNICDNNRAYFIRRVSTGGSLKLVLINNASVQSRNPEEGEIVRIYAYNNSNTGLFSVTCGSASDSVTRTTRPTLVTGTTEAFNKGTHKSLPTRSEISDITSEFSSLTRLKIDASNCDGPQRTVIDDAGYAQNITSHCGCTIKSNFTGELILASKNACSPGFHVFDDNGTCIQNVCDNNRAHFRRRVSRGDSLKLVLINNASVQSTNPGEGEIVQIYADNNSNTGLFSVTCGSASDSVTTITRPTLVTGIVEDKVTTVTEPDTYGPNTNASRSEFPYKVTSVTEPDTYGPNLNASRSEFPYMHAVAAGCIVVAAIIIFVFICIRRRNRTRNTRKEERKEARTYNNATNGNERPENVDPGIQQQLPDNPLYHSYQVNDDNGYSTFGNGNLVSTEQLPDNPHYHSYQENGGKEDSKNEKDVVGTLPLQDSNAVYAQPNKLTRASNANPDDSNESQNDENVYAQVNKTKKT